MKFHELNNPTCSRCEAANLQAYGAICDAEGDVQSVHCIACKDAIDIARWARDGRLRSSLTLAAALKAQSRPVVVTMQGLWTPPHPWEPTLMFRDGEGSDLSPVLYTPRDSDFRQPVTLSLHTRTTAEMRALTPARVFDLYDHGRRVAQGYAAPWDMRWLDVAEAHDRVHACMKAEFEPRVWFGGVQETVQRATRSGLKAEAATPLGKVEMLVFSSAGRCLMQLDTATARVTVIADESSPDPRSGLQGIDATEAEATALLNAATEVWCAGGFELVESTTVGMG